MIDLRNATIRKETPENENPNKIVDIVGKIFDFNKQMLQKLPIVLAQLRAGNTSENVLNEIRQIIYSLHREKEVTKKVYNNIMNSIKL